MILETFQVDWRRRCRSWNSGLWTEAACFFVAYRDRLSAAPEILTPPSSVRFTMAAGLGCVRVDFAAHARCTRGPTAGSRNAEASFATSRGVSRSKVDR